MEIGGYSHGEMLEGRFDMLTGSKHITVTCGLSINTELAS